MRSSVWLLLEQQISAGDFVPVEIGFSESTRRTNAESGGEAIPERLEKGTVFAFNMHAWRKAYSVPFCVLLNYCLCSCCGHGLVLSFKWISDNRLRKARRDLGCSLQPQSHCEPGRVHRLLFHTNATKSSCSRDHIEENNVFFFLNLIHSRRLPSIWPSSGSSQHLLTFLGVPSTS